MPSTMGERLRQLRKAAGLTQADVAYQSRDDLPEPMRLDQSKLSRLESGKIPEAQADPFEIAYLAHIYEVPTAEISEIAEANLRLYATRVTEMLDPVA